MRTYHLQWLPPRTDGNDPPKWMVYMTDCGTYRIDYDAAANEYIPRKLVRMATDRHADITERNYNSISMPLPTLDAAMRAINVHHCATYNLVLA